MVEAVSMEHEIDFQLRLLHMPSALFFFFPSFPFLLESRDDFHHTQSTF